MSETRPSLAYRLAWLFPPVGLLIFALMFEGPKVLDIDDPAHVWAGLAGAIWLLSYAARLATDALKRRSL